MIDSDSLLTEPQYDLVATHTIHGTSAYTIIRGIESNITDQWESQIVRVDHYQTDPETQVLVTNAEWKAFTSGDVADTILPGNRMCVLGNTLQFLDRTTDTIYRVQISTGAIDVFVSKERIGTVSGSDDVRLIDATAFSPTGEMAFYEETSDTLLQVDSEGEVSILLQESDFISLYKKTMTNYVSGGMAYDGRGNLYWTSSNQGGGTGSIYRLAVEGNAELVLDESTIKANTTSFPPQVAFNDIIAAPDGLLYFYDRRDVFVDSIFAFHPDDPNAIPGERIAVIVSREELIEGPAGEDNVSAFAISGNRLTWNMIGRGATDIYTIQLLQDVTFQNCGEVWYYNSGFVGDINRDCQVNLVDMSILGSSWLEGISLQGDLNLDRKIDLADLIIIVQQWLECNDPENPDCM